jgi:hypothetical protein
VRGERQEVRRKNRVAVNQGAIRLRVNRALPMGTLIRLTSQLSPLTSHFLPLTSHLSLLTTYLSPLTSYLL